MQNQIRAIREKKGMSQQQLAELAQTTPAQISRLESGSRRLDMDWMGKLAQALDVTVAQLMGLAPLDFIDDIQAEAAAAPLPQIAGYIGQTGRVIAAEPGALEHFHASDAVRDTHALAALQVEGDYLLPFLPNGTVLYYDKRVFGVPKAFLGTFCIVKLANTLKKSDEIWVCRVLEGKKAGYYRLESLDRTVSTQEEVLVEWSAQIRWIKLP